MINEELKSLLISLKDRDRELRTEIFKEGTLNDGYDPKMEAWHLKNTEKLDEIIEKLGWPGKSLVGTEGSDATFMLACHSKSTPSFQRKFLQHVQEAVKNQEAIKAQAACLGDRIRFNEGKPLKYGMLFDWDESGELVANVEDLDLTNELRKEMGLKTVEEESELHRKKIEMEGGGPSSDFHEYKREEQAWAKRVGWR
ncbi:MAG: DUF6624 domain-containing protein [Nitrospirales bacterium]